MYVEIIESQIPEPTTVATFQEYLRIQAPRVDTTEEFDRLIVQQKNWWSKYNEYYNGFRGTARKGTLYSRKLEGGYSELDIY